MGVAETVPGVSGGTGAVLTGLYAELVRSVRSVDRQSLRSFKKGFRWVLEAY